MARPPIDSQLASHEGGYLPPPKPRREPNYGKRRIVLGAVMVIIGLLLTHIFARPIIVTPLTPKNWSPHGLYHRIGVLGSVFWVTVGGAILVNGLFRRSSDKANARRETRYWAETP